MNRKPEAFTPVPYPTDKLGLPIHPYELDFTPYWETTEPLNNHHHAFFARSFGRTALGAAFRNLETNQSPVIVLQHVFLHRKYTGIKVPDNRVMLERVEEDFEDGGNFKTYNQAEKRYDLTPITEEEVRHLERTYRGKD